MNSLTTMIILKGVPKDDVKSYKYDKEIKKYQITFNDNKSYNYAYNSFEYIKNPTEIDVKLFKFTNKKGMTFNNVVKVLLFKGRQRKFYRLFFSDNKFSSYIENDLVISENAISNKNVSNYLEYYKIIAEQIGLKSSDGVNILKGQFDKLSFVDSDSVLAMYLNGKIMHDKRNTSNQPVIFPFGSNLSQINAVNNAIDNRVSVIEGPPGTGKTQTILNILANIIIRGKTVAVVSNNNSATDNVYEKLEKYKFSYIAAQLGSGENKKEFISSKQTSLKDLKADILEKEVAQNTKTDIGFLEKDLIKMFENQNMIAVLKQELSDVITEKQYFEEYFNNTYEKADFFRNKNKLSSKKLFKLWIKYQEIIQQNKSINFIFKLESLLFYNIKDFKIFEKESVNIIAILKKQFYDVRIKEINDEIDRLNSELEKFSFKKSISELTEKSLLVLKDSLAIKYKNIEGRKVFGEDDLWKNPNEFLKQYPIILSTTHSTRGSLKDVMYDYVIVDEASQVDLATGVLAMSVAKNIVIVGDLKQLPNVINDKDREKITDISKQNHISAGYRFEEHSLLSSICKVFNDIPKTLLKEHYRCHPKIINFCNQKFYNGELVIMTTDKNEDDVLSATITAKGNHARGHFNQRQIDEITKNILPELNSDDVGIITPYRKQTDALDKELKALEIDISTVHKFQGREKDDIIISTVDNVISEFTDNSNMLNVAVSRAKNRLRVVVSDNEKNENTNIGDLIKYIQYNNFEVKRSDIFSVFDMLYKSYEKERKEYLSKYKKMSEYDSENLMYSVIYDIIAEEEFSKFDVITHQMLNGIIRDTSKLNEEELAYAMNPLTHVDFLIYNTIDKSMVLAVEVDGYAYHNEDTKQSRRDNLKNTILEKYDIPLLRCGTNSSDEKARIESKLLEILG